ncbi:protease Lon-related BREX system protein BrxL [Parvibacter caecicola]|uniref:protease Lon-related BREX system protein BrxL n=1 Tax=Parvibacter caecicola TaxID=747645 RepID=UPI00249C828D|nr:protease Lon-related BREX system protein BrxL [Parvibacter caecicola]
MTYEMAGEEAPLNVGFASKAEAAQESHAAADTQPAGGPLEAAAAQEEDLVAAAAGEAGPEGAAAGEVPFSMDELDRMAVEFFSGRVVRKDLTALMKRSANVPTFVLEYLLGMYCSTEDEEALAEGLERIRKILTNNYVRPDESEAIKSKIRELGQYTVIDKVSARLDEYADRYVASFTNLAIEPFIMPEEYVRSYGKILQGGIWCIMRIEYLQPYDDDALADAFDEEAPVRRKPAGKKRGPEDSPFRVASLKPIQMPNLDLEGMIGLRQHFTTQQWMDLLLRSCGYEPDALSEKQKMHFIARMAPLAERNFNLCELGPRGTGKSYVYKEISPYSILLSGGQTTTANLFGRMNSGRLSDPAARTGLVGHWDCITFDEVAGMRFRDVNAIQILKDYMASGSYARGRDQLNADASLVLEGNINDTVANVLKTTHLFDPFPPEFNNDSAFFDRIHLYLPGWEVPKMRSDLLTGHYGLITDCLSEFCHEMRRRDFTHLIDRYFRLNNDFNRRDEIGVRKTFGGMAKLLFPDQQMTKEDVEMLLEYAIEGRRRVKEQLKTMAGVEFNDVNLGYVDAENPAENHVVYVPEQSHDALVPEGEQLPGFVFGIGPSLESGEVAVYRLENKAVAGEFDFKTEGVGRSKPVKESMEAAFQFFDNNAGRVAAGMHAHERDYLLFYNDLQKKGHSAELSLAEFVGLCSAACNRPVVPSMVIPGVLRMSGTLDEVRNLEEVLRVAKNAGAKKVLLPMSCLQDLAQVPSVLLESVSPEFYATGDAVSAAKKDLGL